LINIGMKILLYTMDSGIGAATTYNGYVLTEYFRQAILHYLLYANRIRLILPTVIGGAVVGYFEEVSHNNCQLTIDN